MAPLERHLPAERQQAPHDVARGVRRLADHLRVFLEPVGRLLLDRSLQDAKAKGHRLVILVGDEPYYSRVGFKVIPKGRAIMLGPVDYSRLLVAELVEGAFEGVSGEIRPDWSKAR